MMKKIVLLMLVLSLGLAGMTQAAVIDFESFADLTVVSGTGVFTDLTFSKGTNKIYTHDGIPGPDFTGTKMARSIPFSTDESFRADFTISGVTSVSVVMGDYNADLDNLFLQAYNSSNVLLDSATFSLPSTTNGGPTLSVSSADIAYVIFGSTGTSNNSVFFDNFSYNVVPLPPTALLLGSGLLGLVGWRRFRKS